MSHDNVVQVIEVGSQDEIEYIVMEKLQGYNLKELFEMGSRFTLAQTFEIMLQLLAGLSACHGHGIVHRDVKPANVVQSPDGLVKLTDFGIARIITDQTLSRAGTVVGTPNYMSPEQIKGDSVDPRSDIFSAGVLLYELVTGKKPFDGPDVTSIMYNVTNVHPAPPTFFNGALPEDLEAVVYKAMAKDASARYATAEEFATALRELEQSLHYRENTEAILSALPSAPAPQAAAGTSALSPAPPVQSSTASIGGPAIDLSAQPLSGAGSIVTGTVYCIDCGMANREDQEFCTRCMRPLIKRADISKLAGKQARALHRTNRGDYVFLSCLSVITAGVVLLILYLFFRGV
jgi:serine/threonine-protein kinase